MAKGKELKGKIKSIKEIGKVTKAMELVATSKIKFYRDKMLNSRHYHDYLINFVSKFSYHNAKSSNISIKNSSIFFETRQNYQNVLYVVVSTNRGLCGSLNSSLFKAINLHIKTNNNDVSTHFLPIGEKACAKYKNWQALSKFVINEKFTLQDMASNINVLLDKFLNSEIDAVYICYNRYVNSMVQEPKLVQVLPAIDLEYQHAIDTEVRHEFSFDTDMEQVFLLLGRRYLEFMFYQANLENLACEQVARILAMQMASDNADNLVKDLGILYNKERQALITQEISEIVAGS